MKNPEIDLTLTKMFVSEYTGIYDLDSTRDYKNKYGEAAIHYGFFGNPWDIKLSNVFKDLFDFPKIFDAEYKEKQNTKYDEIAFYEKFFDTFHPEGEHYFGPVGTCDCCGVELNPLNSAQRYSLCVKCDHYDPSDNALIDSLSESL